MLEKIDLSRTLPKKKYKTRLLKLQNRLHQVQRACWNEGLSSVLVFEGWEAAGKGSAIRKVTERLEPRGFDLHSVVAPRTVELQMPWLYRFWSKVPSYGHMAIFHRSWYSRVLGERVNGLAKKKDRQRAYADIASFEKTLADDRYEVIKFFLHIDKREQRRRLKKLRADTRHSWELEAVDWKNHEKYDEYLDAAEEMLKRTEATWAPWTVVEATNKRWTVVKVLETAIDRLENRLRKSGGAVPVGMDEENPEEIRR